MFKKIRKYLLEKLSPPVAKLLPTQRWMTVNKEQKITLPKNPEAHHLRNLSRDPIVRRAITIVQNALARQDYVIDVIGGRGKMTKQIQIVKNIIEHPNVVDTRKSFIKRMLDDSMVLDAMCCEVARCDDANHPIYLYPVDSATIQHLVPVDFSNPNALRYAQQQSDGMKYFTANELAYVQRDYFTYQPYGLSPVRIAYDYVHYYLEAMDSANARATNGTAGFLVDLEDVSQEEREQFIEYFANEIEGTGKIPIVNGTKVSTHQIRNVIDDSSYLQWQERLTRIISVAFGIPVEKLGIVMANDRSTGEDQENAMIQELIDPYSSMVEDFYNTYVIGALGLGGMLRFRFITEESERQKTTKSKRLMNEYYQGAITENEVRKFMGYDESDSKYANVTYPEKTVLINVDNGIVGGFNGVGNIKDTSDSDYTDNVDKSKGGDDDG